MQVDKTIKAQLKAKYPTEQVFVVPFNAVSNIGDKFTPANKIQPLDHFTGLGNYIMRHDAEYNPEFQQLIPYILITNKEGDRFYVSKRIKGDARLVSSLSLGFGGHINPCDGYTDPLMNALERELSEEVSMTRTKKDPVEFIGCVRDLTSSTPDHLGFVFIVKTWKGTVSIKEKDTLEGIWMTKQELFDHYGAFESWAKLIIDYLYQSQEKAS